jgi:TRAP-type transport system small permease protein
MIANSLLKKLSLPGKFMSYIGNISIAGMTLLSAADVVGRYFFNSPILGAYEITEYLMLIMVFSYLGITQSQKAHINVDIVFNHLSPGFQAILTRINDVICLLMMIIVSCMGVQKVLANIKTGEASILLKIPDYPFAIFMTIGCVVLTIEFLKDVFAPDNSGKTVKKEDNA